jgi:hypothetical protein
MNLGATNIATLKLGSQQVSRVMLGSAEAWSDIIPGWESIIGLSSIGDSVVSTDGTLVEAVNLGTAAAKTVNGVVFTGATSRNGLASSHTDPALYVNGVISTEFEGIMDSFCWGGLSAILTLTGLLSGKWHLVQLFCSDDRSAAYQARTQTYTLGAFSSGPHPNGDSYSLIGRFIATGTTQNITITASVAANLQGFQLRRLT